MDDHLVMPRSAATLRELLEPLRRTRGGHAALVAGDTVLSYAQLAGRAAGVVQALRAQGIHHGDRVALLLPNGPAFLEVIFGTVAIGAIAVPMNTRLHPQEHVRLLQDCRPRVLVAHADYRPAVSAITAALPGLAPVVLDGGAPAPGELAYADWRAEDAALPGAAVAPEDVAALLYTSGTTSAPKGVMLTHAGYLADFAHVAAEIGVTPDSVNLQLSPLYHAAAVHTLVHLAAGATTVLMPRFDAAEVLAAIEHHRVSYLFAVPTMLYQLLDEPTRGRHDLGSLRTISYGAAAIAGARLEQALAVFGCKLLHAYGMTETTSHASVLRPAEHLVAAGSIGRGLPGTVLRVVDEAGADVAPGAIGEILVQGPQLMRGYWQRPDDRGYLFIVDRKKDMVISGGVNVYPREAEEVLARHPAVADVAVYGVPDPLWGEALAAAAVLKPGQHATPQALLEFARSQLAGFKLPKQLAIVDSLPKTASGKVRKTELRQQHAAPAAAAPQP